MFLFFTFFEGGDFLDKTKKWLDRFIKIFLRSELRILPGQLAFFIVLSLVPTITLTVYFTSLLSISPESEFDFILNNIPREISELLMPYVKHNYISFGVGFSMLTGFVVASNGAHSIINTSNMLYKVEGNSYIKRRIKAFFMTILLVILFIFMLAIFILSDFILKWIFSLGFFLKMKHMIYMIYNILRLFLALGVIFVIVKVLYTMAPDKKINSKSVNKGSFFSTVSFIIVMEVYTYYVTHFSNYNVLYGGLSSLIILMIFIYILSYIFIVGMVINTSEYKMENNTSHE